MLFMTHQCSSEERRRERLLLYVPLHLCSLAGISDSSDILHNVFTSLCFSSSTLPCRVKKQLQMLIYRYNWIKLSKYHYNLQGNLRPMVTGEICKNIHTVNSIPI